VKVRRTSAAGVSSAAITVAPEFETAAYVSIGNKTKLTEKVYAPVDGRKIVSATMPNPGTYILGISDNSRFCREINNEGTSVKTRIKKLNDGYDLVAIRVYTAIIQDYYRHWTCAAILEKDGVQEESYIYGTYSTDAASFRRTLSSMGINLSSNWSGQDETVAISSAYGALGSKVTKKVIKIYASVESKTKLAYEDLS
jgi:hypothetical protein